jgi:hypothetical protein
MNKKARKLIMEGSASIIDVFYVSISVYLVAAKSSAQN